MIGQINIVVDPLVDNVDGYININTDQLSSVTNGYVESIVFTTIDKLDNNTRNSAFIECLKKLTPGGKLTVKFLNLIVLSSRLKENYIDGAKFAELVKGHNSFWTESDFMSIVASISDYKLIKLINEDLNLVAVIEKNK